MGRPCPASLLPFHRTYRPYMAANRLGLGTQSPSSHGDSHLSYPGRPGRPALDGMPEARRRGQRGQPAKKGRRLPTPKQLAARRKVGWQEITVLKQGRQVQRQVWAITCLWYHVCPETDSSGDRTRSCWMRGRRDSVLQRSRCGGCRDRAAISGPLGCGEGDSRVQKGYGRDDPGVVQPDRESTSAVGDGFGDLGQGVVCTVWGERALAAAGLAALVHAQDPTVAWRYAGGLAKGLVAASNNHQLDVLARSSQITPDRIFCPFRGRVMPKPY